MHKITKSKILSLIMCLAMLISSIALPINQIYASTTDDATSKTISFDEASSTLSKSNNEIGKYNTELANKMNEVESVLNSIGNIDDTQKTEENSLGVQSNINESEQGEGEISELKNEVESLPQSNDLNQFVREVIIYANKDSYGNYIVENNKVYDLTITFEELQNLQFADKSKLFYKIPEGLKVKNTQSILFDIKIDDEYGRAVISENVYKISDGVIYINLNDNDTDFERLVKSTNVSFDIKLDSRFEEGTIKLDFGNDVIKSLKVDSDEKHIEPKKTEDEKDDFSKETSNAELLNKVKVDDLLNKETLNPMSNYAEQADQKLKRSLLLEKNMELEDFEKAFMDLLDSEAKSVSDISELKNISMFRRAAQARAVTTSTDLEKFITDVKINATVDEHGNYVIKPNGMYELEFTFDESEDLQFDDNATLSYKIPTDIKVANLANKTFDINIIDSNGSGVVSGNTFRVDNGYLHVEFNKNDPNFNRLKSMANVMFKVGVVAQFTGASTEIQFNSKVKKTFKFDLTSNLSITKEVKHVRNAKKAEYTLKVKSDGSNNNVVITDTIVGTALTLNQDVVVKSNINNNLNVTPVYENNKFTISGINMINDEELTITYTANIDYDKLTSLGTPEETKNIASVKSDENPTPKTVEKSRQFDFIRMEKKVIKREPMSNDPKKYKITWELDINREHLLTTGGVKIEDYFTYDDNRVYFAGGNVNVTVKKENGQTETRVLNIDSLANKKNSKNQIIGWAYTPPVEDGKASYKFTIDAIVDVDGIFVNMFYYNNLKIGKQHITPGDTVTSGEGSDIKATKEVVSYNAKEIKWIIKLPVSDKGHNSYKLIDDTPYTILNGDLYNDSIIKESLKISGLLPGESYTVTHRDSGQYQGPSIEFFKDEAKQNKGLLPSQDGQIRYITITMTTKVNQDWLNKAHESGYVSQAGKINPVHTNGMSVSFDNSRWG